MIVEGKARFTYDSRGIHHAEWTCHCGRDTVIANRPQFQFEFCEEGLKVSAGCNMAKDIGFIPIVKLHKEFHNMVRQGKKVKPTGDGRWF